MTRPGDNSGGPLHPATQALMVGGEPIERRRLRHRLEEAGFAAVHDAARCVEAAPILASELVDAVFVLKGDPDCTVTDVRRLLAGRGPNRDPALVMLDDGPAGAEQVAAVKAGAVAVLPALPSVAELHALRARRRRDAAELNGEPADEDAHD